MAKPKVDTSNESSTKAENQSRKSSKSGSKSEKKRSQQNGETLSTASGTSFFLAPKASLDPSLESLFASSSGPTSVQRPALSASTVQRNDTDLDDEEEEEDKEDLPEDVVSALAASREALHKEPKKKRKRSQLDDLEDKYMDKLHDDVGEEPEKERRKKNKSDKDESKRGKKPKKSKADKATLTQKAQDGDELTVDGVVSNGDTALLEFSTDKDGESEDDKNESDSDSDPQMDDSEDEVDSEDDSSRDKPTATVPDAPPKHESLGKTKDDELDKANRTVFVGNLPSSIITSKPEYRTLKQAFQACGTIESVRFRSVAFSDLIPRKAAFVTKALHVEQTTMNAYIVFKKSESARAAQTLNGTVVLSRHLRVDSVAHPAKQDAKRCVFVGNLDFEASEESLWKHFGQCGKVDNVRIVRDAKTNVGKGIAYVSFEDQMTVDQALLLDGQKMADDKHKRKLRVTRSKTLKRKSSNAPGGGASAISTGRAPRQGAGFYVPKPDPKQAGMLGRAGKLLGRAGAAKMKRPKIGENEVFEGTRATAGMDSGVRKGGTGKKKGKPRARASARTTAWKQKQKKPAT